MEFIKRDIKKQNRNGELSPTTISYISSIGGSNEVGGNYLPAIDNGDGTYTVDLTQVTFNGNLLATGEVTAYKSGESGGGGGGSVTVYDGLDSTDKTIALSANQGRILKGLIDNIGDVDLTGYYNKTEIESLISGYSKTDHKHIISDITDLQSTLDNKSETTHTHTNYLTKGSWLNQSDINFDNLTSSAFYSYASGNGTGNINNPNTYGLMAVFGSNDGYAAQLSISAENVVKVRTKYHRSVDGVSGLLWNNWTTLATKNNLDDHIDNTTKHITSTERTNWNTAYTNNHTHSNKTVLDGITSAKVSNWDNVYSNWNKVFNIDTDGNLKVKVNVIGEKEISAWGAGTSTGGGGGVDIVDALTSTRSDAALSANQGKVLKGLIDNIDFSGYYNKTEVDDKLKGYHRGVVTYTNASNAGDTTTAPEFLGYATGLPSGFHWIETKFYQEQTVEKNRMQIAYGYDGNYMAYRRFKDGSWKDWKQVAFVDDVDTKLNNFYKLCGWKDGTWNWNDVTTIGTYKIQGGTITNHPTYDGVTKQYQYGLAMVLKGSASDTEDRTIQLFFPHAIYGGQAVHYRMLNNGAWGNWGSLPNKTYVDNGLAEKAPLLHTHSEYYTLTNADNTFLPFNTSTKYTLTSSNSGVVNFKSTSNIESGIRLYLGDTNGGGLWYNSTNGIYLYNGKTSKKLGIKDDGTPFYGDYTLYHTGNFNPANYLPLSGGTLSNSGSSLTINRTATNATPYITFQSNGTDVGYIGVTPDKQYVGWDFNISQWRTFLNTGNYSSYALPLSGGQLSNSATGLFINRTTEGTNPHICFRSQGTNVGDIGINYDGTKPMWYNYNTNTWNDIITSDNAANYTIGNSTKFNGYSLRGSTHGHNIIDAKVTKYIDLSGYSTSNFYPVIFAQSSKTLHCEIESVGGSANVAYNMNKLSFSFSGQGWTDCPKGLTVHFYNCYTASETTIGCIGMGDEGGAKCVWLRGGCSYYITSNINPSLKTSNYTDGNQIFTVGVNFSGGSNTKVTTYWIPQTTSGLGTMYHSSGLAVGAGLSVQSNASIKGTLTNTGLATFSGGLTTTTGTFNRVNAAYVNWRNNLGVQVSKVGWYRFAVATVANNSGGNVIFTIRREYYNTDNEAYTLMANIDFGGCNWTQLGGSYRTQLITKVRCTYDSNGTMYFDFYYTGTVNNGIYVNCIGDAYCQTPTLVTSALGATNELALTNGYKIGTKTAYALTLYRTATDAGSFIMYGANNQLTKTWAVGADSKLRFGWYYKDTSAGTDVEKMWLDSNAELCFATGINGRKMKIPSSSGAITYYATNNGAAWNMGNFFNNNADSAVIGGIAAYGEGDTFKYYWMGTAHNGTNTIKFYNNGNVSSSCWGISNLSTNPNFHLIHNGVYWYLQGNNGYLYIGAGSAKSLRIDSSGNCLSVGEITAHSDRRLKDNIKPLEVRGELNPVTYTKDGKESIGFIADEVKEIYPELVITDDSTEEKYLSLNYAQLTAVLYAEIKELKKEINELKNKI